APGGGTLPHSVCCLSVRVTAMYTTAVSWKHMIGLVFVVVVLVFGVTYTSMLLGNRPGTSDGLIKTGVVHVVQDTDPLASTEPRELEWHKEANQTFYFHNDNTDPVNVWLHRKSCKCTRVDAAVIPEELKALSADANAKGTWDANLSWQTLEGD